MPGLFRQHLQKGTERRLCLPQNAEDGFLEVPRRAGETRGALSAGEDELTGDEPRQLADLKNAAGRAVVYHGS